MNIIETAKEALLQQLRAGNTVNCSQLRGSYQITARDILSDAIADMSDADVAHLVLALSGARDAVSEAAWLIQTAVEKTINVTANDNLIGWLAAEKERVA